ncbi:MAG TPA: ABC transporter permease [Acidobacteriaceae bacterium]|nr:ABC transporter permease [Acidobacteriaceae bacterium]
MSRAADRSRAPEPTSSSSGSHWLPQLRRHRLASAGLFLVTVFVLLALFAPWLAPFDPAGIHLTNRLAGPSASHLFGTDELGRDILSRVLFGARISLGVAFAVVVSSLGVGTLLGALAGFCRGWVDTLINVYLSNAFLALPGILLAVAIVAFLGPSLPNLILALALPAWVGYARLVRAQVLALREREFVQAARSLGASDTRLLLRSILPHTLPPVLVQAAVGMAAAVLAEATLSFLGLGVQPPAATWGAMLNAARSHLFEAPHLVAFPSFAIALCVLAFNLLGDGLRDALDPRHLESR